MQIADEIGVKNLEAYGDSKLIINQVLGKYEVRHEDLGSKTFTSTMYHASKMRTQMYWHLSASLALLAGVVEKILVYNHNLYCLRIASEDYQKLTETVKSKKLLSRQPVQNLETGDSLTLTMSCTASCLMIPKKRLTLEGKPPNST